METELTRKLAELREEMIELQSVQAQPGRDTVARLDECIALASRPTDEQLYAEAMASVTPEDLKRMERRIALASQPAAQGEGRPSTRLTPEHAAVAFRLRGTGKTEVEYMLVGRCRVKKNSKLIYAGAELSILGVMYAYTEQTGDKWFPPGTRCFAISLIGTEWEEKIGRVTALYDGDIDIIECSEPIHEFAHPPKPLPSDEEIERIVLGMGISKVPGEGPRITSQSTVPTIM